MKTYYVVPECKHTWNNEAITRASYEPFMTIEAARTRAEDLARQYNTTFLIRQNVEAISIKTETKSFE